MKLRDTAEFFTDLPDGAVEDNHGFVVWPGRPVAEAIVEILVGFGCEAGPIVSVDFKGWEFEFRYRGRGFWSRVTMIERHIATFDDPDIWPKIIGRRHRLFVEMLGRLGEALARDPRFHDVRWFAPNEVETEFEGTLMPLG